MDVVKAFVYQPKTHLKLLNIYVLAAEFVCIHGSWLWLVVKG